MVNLNQIIQRLIRVIKFDTTVYKEIEHDENATVEAAIVVVGAYLLSAIGSAIGARSFLSFIVVLISGVLLNWLLWSLIIMFVGTRLFKGEATFWEVARTIGYANIPAALGILSLIPYVGILVNIVVLVLSLVMGFFAIREALDLPTDKTIITIIIGWVVIFVINLVLS
ncbi:MAG: YIP1 family protein [Anaerolineae bacterium]|nr:YIP1 family protein [Anaerolineae bacterium]